MFCPTNGPKPKDIQYSPIEDKAKVFSLEKRRVRFGSKLIFKMYYKYDELETTNSVFVDFSAQIEHNKAVNVPLENTWHLTAADCTAQTLVMEGLANASPSAISCAKSSSVHRRPLADIQS